MTIPRISDRDLMRPSARTIRVSSPSFIRPAPSLRLFCCKASISWSMPIFLAAMRVLFGEISKLLTKPPSALTSATPGTVRSAGRITQSSRLRRSIKVKSPPSIENMNISPRGVVIGAIPPSTPSGKSSQIVFKRSAIC